MKKLIKKTGLLILAAALIIGFMPVFSGTAHAVTMSGNTGSCTWNYDPASYTLTISGNGTMADYGDTSYGNWKDTPWDELSDSYSINKVIVEDGVTSIGGYAFAYLDFTSLTLPDSIESIGAMAFMGCEFSSIVIPENVTEIGHSAFYDCGYLADVRLNNKLESVGNYAFYNCGLTSIDLPESLTDIGYYAFGFESGPQREQLKSGFSMTVVGNTEGEEYAKYNNIPYTCSYYAPVDIGDYDRFEVEVDGIKDKVYTGKALTQSIELTQLDKTLVKGKDYKVAYSNNKKVGKATVTITGIGDYTGKIVRTFKINPKGTSISKLTKKKKAFTVKWKKQAAQTSGYQVRYSLKSGMSKAKKKTISGSKKTSATVKKLKAKKKYYVQVRTYKTVSGKKYYSKWSKKKTVKTK